MKQRKLLLLSFLLSVFLIPAFSQTTYVNGLVVVVRYNDYKINATNAQIDAMLNQESGFNLWGNTTSVKQFFKVQSDNKFILSSTVVDVDLPNNSSYYHGPNLPYNGGHVLVQDVVAAVRAKYPSGFTGLTMHPTDNRLWHFSIISQSAPWEGAGVAYGVPTQYIINNGQEMPITNVALISYRQTNAYETSVVCHEYGHSVLGWTDYYQTGNSNTGDYDVMGSAGTTKAPMPINPGLRYQKGWIGDVVEISGTTNATYTLTANSYSQIHKYTNPANPREYLLFHALKHGGYYQSPLDNGKVMDEGLAIWYVDEDGSFDVPGYENQYRIKLVQADNMDEMHDERIPNMSDIRGDLDDLYDNISNSFPNGTPFRWKDGGEFGIFISNISAPGNTMSFTVNARPNTVVATSDNNGNISPKGTLSVPSGNQVFTFTPNVGYELDAVYVNGLAVPATNPYTMTGISGTKTIHATFKKKATLDPLPSPWQHVEVGVPSGNGFASYTSGKFGIESFGSRIGGGTDNFSYVFQTLNGDGSIVAKVAYSNKPTWDVRFGLMIRESLQANSVYAMIAKQPGGAITEQRTSEGANAVSVPLVNDISHVWNLFNWLRISRVGTQITTSVSRDGVNWENVSQQYFTTNSSIYIGMVVTGALGNYPAKVEFENVTVTTSNPSPMVTLTSPINNSTYPNPASITISADASDANGSITKVDFYSGSELIGTDYTAPYSFVWNTTKGGSQYITAKATDNQQAVTTSIPVLIHLPCSITDAKLSGTVIGSEGSWNGYGATREKAFDGDIYTFFDGNQDVVWTGLDLNNDYRITAIKYYPRDGYANRMVGGKFQGSNTPDFSSGVVDLATVIIDPDYDWNCVNITNTSSFRYVRYICAAGGFGNVNEIEFYGNLGGNISPTVSITTPANNASFTAPATIAIEANASDADGTISKVELFIDSNTNPTGIDVEAPYTFFWSNVPAGTYSITVKATDNNGAVTTSAPVTVIVTNPTTQTPYGGTAWAIPGTIEAENYDLGGQGVAFNDVTPANEGGAYRSDAVDIESFPGGYSVGYIATDEWLEYTVNVAAGTYSIEARVASIFAGKAFRLEMDGVSIASFIVPNTGGWHIWQSTYATGVTLTAGQKILRIYADSQEFNIDKLIFTQAGNMAPTVSITSPSNNASYTAPASVTINANAADADGTISKVEFYQGTTLLATVTSSPFNYTWTNVAAGTYSITAKAYDNENASTTSSAVSITVNAPTNQAPTVSITSPANNASFTEPASVTINTNAADADGTISKVEFYQGTTLLATVTSSPFNYTWTNVAAGTYSLTAKAYDNNNASTTSSAVSITVTGGGNCTAPVWNSNVAYVGTNVVQYNGIKYVANWWTMGERPDLNNGPAGSGQPWTSQGTCTSRMGEVESLVSAVQITIAPNPVENTAIVYLSMEEDEEMVYLYIMDQFGRKISDVYQGSLQAGNHSFVIDSDSLIQGLYILSVTSQTKDTKVPFVKQ
ncbi:MAG TPA: Ig-like domain-containing protein [Cytophagaceae bacterium]